MWLKVLASYISKAPRRETPTILSFFDNISPLPEICSFSENYPHTLLPGHWFPFGFSYTPRCSRFMTPTSGLTDHFSFTVHIPNITFSHLQKQLQDLGFSPPSSLQTLLEEFPLSIRSRTSWRIFPFQFPRNPFGLLPRPRFVINPLILLTPIVTFFQSKGENGLQRCPSSKKSWGEITRATKSPKNDVFNVRRQKNRFPLKSTDATLQSTEWRSPVAQNPRYD